MFLNGLTVAIGGACAHDGRGDFGEPGNASCGNRVAAAKKKLRGDLRHPVRLDEDDLHTIREGARCALWPGDGALGAERWNICCSGFRSFDDCRTHCAPPFPTGRRIRIERCCGTSILRATSRTCSGVTARNLSSTELMSCGSLSKRVKQAK